MNKVMCLLFTALWAMPAMADVAFDDIAAYERDAYSRDVTQCDTLAGHPSDPERVTEGVGQSAMDKPAAIEACLAAVKDDPKNPRLNYQLARAYGYSGLHVEGDPYRDTALRAGYPQSLFVMGYIRLEGWDGRPADACYGGELVRLSALAGRYAGLVGFPHYLMTGRFDGCDAYPLVDDDQIAGFIAQAEKDAGDYYQRLLVQSLQAHWAAR